MMEDSLSTLYRCKYYNTLCMALYIIRDNLVRYCRESSRLNSKYGEVSELADEHDLGSCAARRRSSSLLFPSTRGGNPRTVRQYVVSYILDGSNSQRRIDFKQKGGDRGHTG